MTSVQQWQEDYQARVRARRSRLAGRVRYGLKPPRRDRTAIVTDSSAAIPASVLRHPLAVGLRQIPMPVMVGEQIYAEGSEELHHELPFALASNQPVRTSRPSPGTFEETYRELEAAGYARIVSVHISGGLSGTVEAARMAATRVRIPVEVVDSRTTGMALGFMVMEAAVRAGFGLPVGGILDYLRGAGDQSLVLFTVPNLEQLRRGGRISALKGLIGSMLQVKPVLALREGTISLVERTRSVDAAVDRMAAAAQAKAEAEPCSIAVHGYGNRRAAEALAVRLQPFSQVPVPVVDFPAVLAAHLGLGGIGVIVAPLAEEAGAPGSGAQGSGVSAGTSSGTSVGAADGPQPVEPETAGRESESGPAAGSDGTVELEQEPSAPAQQTDPADPSTGRV